MASYIRFAAQDGGTVLVEVDDAETKPTGGVVKAGLKDRAEGAITEAQAAFGDALQRVVRLNAQAVVDAVDGLPKRPDEVELSFGLKATGEAGNFAICKAGVEVNYSVRVVWKLGTP